MQRTQDRVKVRGKVVRSVARVALGVEAALENDVGQ